MSTSARFTKNITPLEQGTDKTDRIKTNQYLTPVYAAAITVKPIEALTLIKPAALTGALTLNLGVGSATTPPYVGDEVKCIFESAAGATVTYGTGTLPTVATQVIAAGKTATVSFMFNGTAWIETSRSATA